jgi:hypothetical protein
MAGMSQKNVPVASTGAVFLDLLGVYVGEATLGEELGHRLDGQRGAFGDALVVTVVGLGGACHCHHVRWVYIIRECFEDDPH